MREHQIIINLKPEHFQELERLARISGAKSVSVFVKEQVLRVLGLGSPGNVKSLPRPEEISAISSDIKRLHQELQVFIAESLADRDFGYLATPHKQESVSVLITSASPDTTKETIGPPIDGAQEPDSNVVPVTITQSLPARSLPADTLTIPSPPAPASEEVQAEPIGEAAKQEPVTWESNIRKRSISEINPLQINFETVRIENEKTILDLGDEQAEIDLESIAAIEKSPHAAQAAGHAGFPDTGSTKDADDLDETDETDDDDDDDASYADDADDTGDTEDTESTDDPADTDDKSDSDNTDETNQTASTAVNNDLQIAAQRAAQAGAQAAAAQLQGGKTLARPNGPDELELLASRAFAISPRLGAIEEMEDHPVLYSDPLDELLGEMEENAGAHNASAAQPEEGKEEDEEEEIPAADNEELAQQAVGSAQTPQNIIASPAGQDSDYKQSVAASMQDDDDWGEDAQDDVSVDHSNTAQPAKLQESNNSTQIVETQDAVGKQGSGDPHRPPPFSGGPPPRRRRT